MNNKLIVAGLCTAAAGVVIASADCPEIYIDDMVGKLMSSHPRSSCDAKRYNNGIPEVKFNNDILEVDFTPIVTSRTTISGYEGSLTRTYGI